MLVYNQEPCDQTRVNLFHLSTSIDTKFEETLDMCFQHIWTQMHCSSIRIFLHHFKQGPDEKLKVNDEIKGLLKQRRFKWKTLKNETSTGKRIEVLEGMNLEHKEQTKVETCVISRQGVQKKDFMRSTFSFKIQTETVKELATG